MQSLDLNEIIELDTGPHSFVERQGSLYRLRHVVTNAQIDLPIAELARRRVDTSTQLPDSGSVLDDLTPEQRAVVDAWANHLEEFETGVHPNVKKPRPEYSLDLPQGMRMAAKIAEMQAAGIPCSKSTFYDKLARFRDDGPDGAVDGRVARAYEPLASLHPEIRGALEFVLAKRGRSKGTIKRLIIEARAEIVRRLGREADQPSDSSMYRYIELLDRGRVKTSMKAQETNDLVPNRPFQTKVRMLPGEECQIDSTLLDVNVLLGWDKKGNPIVGRVVLTIMLDVATRSIIAFTLRKEGAKGIDHVALLLQAMTPREHRPDRAQLRERVAAEFSNHHFLSSAERKRFEELMPFVRPGRLMMDNGKDFRSNVFKSATRQLGIDLTYAPPHGPTAKSHVERQFGTINDLWTQYLPGHLGNSPVNRASKTPKQVSKEAKTYLTIDALFELFDD